MRTQTSWRILARKLSSYSYSGNGNESRIVYGIVGVNTVVFGMWQYAEEKADSRFDYRYLTMMNDNFILSNNNVFVKGKLHTLITSTISHKDGWHFLSNMATLIFLGPTAAMSLGVRRFLGL